LRSGFSRRIENSIHRVNLGCVISIRTGLRDDVLAWFFGPLDQSGRARRMDRRGESSWDEDLFPRVNPRHRECLDLQKCCYQGECSGRMSEVGLLSGGPGWGSEVSQEMHGCPDLVTRDRE
jgi:hypothetical protein